MDYMWTLQKEKEFNHPLVVGNGICSTNPACCMLADWEQFQTYSICLPKVLTQKKDLKANCIFQQQLADLRVEINRNKQIVMWEKIIFFFSRFECFCAVLLHLQQSTIPAGICSPEYRVLHHLHLLSDVITHRHSTGCTFLHVLLSVTGHFRVRQK